MTNTLEKTLNSLRVLNATKPSLVLKKILDSIYDEENISFHKVLGLVEKNISFLIEIGYEKSNYDNLLKFKDFKRFYVETKGTAKVTINSAMEELEKEYSGISFTEDCYVYALNENDISKIINEWNHNYLDLIVDGESFPNLEEETGILGSWVRDYNECETRIITSIEEN